jgi:hypothetical protein
MGKVAAAVVLATAKPDENGSTASRIKVNVLNEELLQLAIIVSLPHP